MAETYDESLLLSYVEGELSPADRSRVEQMGRKDPRLGQLLRQLVGDRHALRSLPDPAPPDWMMDEVDRQLERAMLVDGLPVDSESVVVQQHYVLRRLMMLGAVAAMVLVVVTVIIASLTGLTPLPPLEVAISNSARSVPPVAPPPPAIAEKPKPESPVEPQAPEAPAVAVTPPKPLDHPPAEAADPLAVIAPSVNPAAPEQPAPAVAEVPIPVAPPFPHDPSVFAGRMPSVSDLLKPPPEIRSESPAEASARIQRDSMRLLTMLAANPEMAPQMELRIVSRDAASTRRLLEALAAPGESAVAGLRRSDDAGGDRYAWRVTAAELPRLLGKLRGAADHVDVQVTRKPLLAAGQLPKAEAPGASAAPWPSLTPDYATILLQQLPAAGSASQARVVVQLPVVIETAAPAAPGR